MFLRKVSLGTVLGSALAVCYLLPDMPGMPREGYLVAVALGIVFSLGLTTMLARRAARGEFIFSHGRGSRLLKFLGTMAILIPLQALAALSLFAFVGVDFILPAGLIAFAVFSSGYYLGIVLIERRYNRQFFMDPSPPT